MGALARLARPDPTRLTAVAVVAAVVVALVLLGLAIARYPGGSDCDAAAVGFDPSCNYLSDLLHQVARDGRPNPAAPLARAAMLAFVAALPPFWALRARGLVRGVLVRRLGTLSAVGWAAVPLVPSDRFGAWHGAAVLVGAGPGLVAVLLAVGGQWSVRRRSALLGLGVLACVGAATLLYARLLLGDASAPSHAIPALQQVAAALLVAWLLDAALPRLRAPEPPARATSPPPSGAAAG